MRNKLTAAILLLAFLVTPAHAALTGWSTSNHLTRSSPVWPGAVGFYVSVWAYRPTGSAANSWIFSLNEVSAHRSLWAKTNDTIELEVSGGVAAPIVSGTHANAAWFHVGGLFNATSQKVYRDAATPSTASGTDAITTPTETKIGLHGPSNTLAWSNTGALAEVSVWNTSGMSVANIDALDAKLYNGGSGGAGGNPLNINAEVGQPWTGKLVAYVLNSANSLTDLAGNGHNFTMAGTLTNFGSHPNIEAVSGGSPARRPVTPVIFP